MSSFLLRLQDYWGPLALILGSPRPLVARRWAGPYFRIWKLVVFFPLHPSVLEPDLDLTLRKAQSVRNLDSTPAGQIAIVVKLLL